MAFPLGLGFPGTGLTFTLRYLSKATLAAIFVSTLSKEEKFFSVGEGERACVREIGLQGEGCDCEIDKYQPCAVYDTKTTSFKVVLGVKC